MMMLSCVPSGVFSHHGHLESVGVEGSDLPVTAHVVDELDEAMQPEHAGDHQHKHHQSVVTDTGETKSLLSALR